MTVRSTTILGVRLKKSAAMGGDGQVTFGDMALKQKAVKVRKFEGDKRMILGGFAGAAADALTLFGKFEEKLEEYNWQLQRAAQPTTDPLAVLTNFVPSLPMHVVQKKSK